MARPGSAELDFERARPMPEPQLIGADDVPAGFHVLVEQEQDRGRGRSSPTLRFHDRGRCPCSAEPATLGVWLKVKRVHEADRLGGNV